MLIMLQCRMLQIVQRIDLMNVLNDVICPCLLPVTLVDVTDHAVTRSNQQANHVLCRYLLQVTLVYVTYCAMTRSTEQAK